METLVNLSWRLYLALPLMALGAALALRSERRGHPAFLCMVRGDPSQLIPLMQCFRAMVIGLAMIGVGAAWIWHLTWLFIVSLTIAVGESMETALVIYALRHGSQLQVGTPRARGRTIP
ncbi:hypothetical protein [Candidatus Entotheonella palauensis]|uniref:Uncharacterized protein n=1 Tax=Candidatus Entotheonella gemina TaxID=1429439 RepID=W4M831_9BACT|nr:hypothetical protein [Candidatus Entotheonella palauensis]ETX06091.1 MAG: hypothetical protein ETSY2_19175 [Candidatus Entotheonella gemina]